MVDFSTVNYLCSRSLTKFAALFEVLELFCWKR